MAQQDKFFDRFGKRVRELRRKRGYSQEDMLEFGFATRHWQRIEAGQPISVATLIRICEIFDMSLDRLIKGLDKDIYKS